VLCGCYCASHICVARFYYATNENVQIGEIIQFSFSLNASLFKQFVQVTLTIIYLLPDLTQLGPIFHA